MTIMLQLPYPPSANRLWVRARKGMRRSDVYMAWLEEAGWLAKAQRPSRIEGPYKLSLHVARPDKRKRDIDNVLKSVGDLLQHIGVVKDDCDCEMVSARWVTTGQGVTAIIEPAGVE